MIKGEKFTPVLHQMRELWNDDVKEIKLYSDLNLQQVYHDFLRRVSIVEDGRIETELLLYNLGKFSQVIADYEIINFTLRPRTKLHNFCSFMKYTASDYYPEGYLTNTYTKPDAVNIMTVYQSKGLEFAAVFVPQLNKNYFPTQRIGGKGIWHILDRSWITDSDRFDGDIEIDMGDGIKVNERIDLVKRKNVDGVDKTYIVDFKTANKEVQESINKEQLKIYALGYQELTGAKADYMEVYQLDSENSARESITDNMIEEVRTEIKDAAANVILITCV